MTATSWQILLVVASKSSVPHAGNNNHIARTNTETPSPRPPSRLPGPPPGRAPPRPATTAHATLSSANTPNPTDHPTACPRRDIVGSTNTGYESSAPSDAKFDSAYNR